MINNTGSYDRTLSRQYPGLFVILLDQSDSMSQLIINSDQTKASLVTRHVNMIIQKMIDIAPVETEPTSGIENRKKYAYLSVIGYNDIVSSLLAPNYTPVDVPSLWNHSLGDVAEVRVILDGNGRVERQVTDYKPIWIKPTAAGNTDMAQAFEAAEKVVQGWLNSPPELISREMGKQAPRDESFPPIVINITDAKDNGANNPQNIVERIQRLGTKKGNVLVCNCHFTNEEYSPCVFPSSIEEVRRRCKEDVAESMFKMSSPIPEKLREEAERYMQNPIEPGARCFVFNANPEILLRFIRWTTLGNVGRVRFS